MSQRKRQPAGKSRADKTAVKLTKPKPSVFKLGAGAVGNTPAEARKFLRAEVEKWAKAVKAAGIASEQ